MPVDGKIHFYFDFLSPFGFFGSLRVNELAEHHGIQCEWHPILLGISVLKVMGLELGMEVENWPPENIEELVKRIEEPF